MLVLQIIKVALRGIMANKLRTGLTTLGIVVGVGSVIVLIGFGEGQKAELMKRFASWGANRIDVNFGFRNAADGWASGWATLNLEDAEAIRQEISTVALVVPIKQGRMNVRVGANRLSDQRVFATEPGIFTISNTQLESGRYLTDEDNYSLARVCVLGHQARSDIFFDAPAIDQDLYIEGKRFSVVGTLKEQEGGRRSSDAVIYVPLDTGREALHLSDSLSSLSINVVDTKYVEMAADDIRELLHQRHPHIPRPSETDAVKAAEADVIMVRTGRMRQEREQTAVSMQKFLIIMGALSLFIGGVGVMNIMLVTVQERTPEIGLRKAVGATSGSILSQFLLESVVICTVGGAVGTLLAIVACRYMAKLPEEAKIPDPVVTPTAVMIAVAVTVAVGLFFGVYPAAKAAQLEPISALRKE